MLGLFIGFIADSITRFFTVESRDGVCRRDTPSAKNFMFIKKLKDLGSDPGMP